MRSIDLFIEKIVSYILVLSVALMLSLTLLNIVLRWFNQNYIWIDPLIRHLVFMGAFLGGTLATGHKNHIRIDVLSSLYESRAPRFFARLDIILSIIAAISCFFMANAGYDFFRVEAEFGKEAFLGLHSAHLVSLIPFGFSLLGIRFLTTLFVEKEDRHGVS